MNTVNNKVTHCETEWERVTYSVGEWDLRRTQQMIDFAIKRKHHFISRGELVDAMKQHKKIGMLLLMRRKMIKKLEKLKTTSTEED